MKVYIKNKLISLKGNSEVLNEQDEPIYNVKGKLISPTHKKLLCDMNDKVLYKIRNKFFKLIHQKALIYNAEGEIIAQVKKKYWKNEYVVEGYSDEIEIQRQSWTVSNMLKNGEIVGTIRKEFTIVRDSFELEANPEDIEFLIALVIAMDNIQDQEMKEK